MKSSFLIILAALFFLLLGLYFVLPRRNAADAPLVEEINVNRIEEVNEREAVEVEVATNEASATPVSEAMEATLRQFLDAIVALEPDASADELRTAYRYLGPALQESLAVNRLTRDDFVVLFDQETKAFPPTSYEIIETEVINDDVQEATVRFAYPNEEPVAYNIELERLDNSWKVIAVNTIE